MADLKQHKLGWIGIGHMGYAMAERLAHAGCDLAVWNCTRAKAEPLAASGAHVVDVLTDLAACDIVFTMVSTGKDVKEVLVGTHSVTSTGKAPQIVVDSTPMALAESADIRAKLAEHGVQFLAALVSDNAHVIKAGKLTVVACTRCGWMLNRLFPPPLWRRGSTVALYRGRRARDVEHWGSS